MKYREMEALLGTNGSNSVLSGLVSYQWDSIKSAIALKKNINALEAEKKIYDSMIDDINKSHLVYDDNGRIKFDEENNPVFIEGKTAEDRMNAINELLNADIENINIAKFKISDLSAEKNLKLSALDLIQLEFMIDMEEVETPEVEEI